MQETWVRSLGGEHPLEKEMATPSSFLAWRIPWTERPGGLQSIESQTDATEHAHTHTLYKNVPFFFLPFCFSPLQIIGIYTLKNQKVTTQF